MARRHMPTRVMSYDAELPWIDEYVEPTVRPLSVTTSRRLRRHHDGCRSAYRARHCSSRQHGRAGMERRGTLEQLDSHAHQSVQAISPAALARQIGYRCTRKATCREIASSTLAENFLMMTSTHTGTSHRSSTSAMQNADMIHVVDGDPACRDHKATSCTWHSRKLACPLNIVYPGTTHGIPDARNQW